MMKYINLKFRGCSQMMLAVVLAMFTLQISGQTLPGTIVNSWFGNSNPDAANHMPQGMEGMFVSPDGAVYTNVPWEEGGAGFVQVKDGVVKHGAQSLGWGAMGGSDVAANSKYVYFTNTKGNEGGGLTGGDYPPKGDYWLGVLRVSKTNIGIGAPFTGGKGFGGIYNSLLVVLQPGDNINASLTGVCATETELFVGCDLDKKIRVYDANTMEFKREWVATNPYQMAIDAQGMLWVAVGFEATKIERYNVNGIKQAQEINLATGSLVGDFCIDKDNRMLVGDVGQREQVLIYTDINTSPVMTSTFGTQFGVFSGVPGKMEPLKFHQVRGIGTDNAGNIYIGNTQWHSGGQGIVLESYTPAGSINWSRYCTMFVDACGADQVTDGQDIYGQVEHFTVDFSKPAGQEATLSAYTVNRYKYPEDPRLKSLAATASMRTYKGKKFLVTIPQSAGRPLTIYRFNAATDGEVAIPCVMWGITDGNNQSYPDAPQGTWLWRDLNANGQMDNNEFLSSTFDAWSSIIDKNMTVWMASSDIYSVVCDGLDANGVPMYEPKLTKTSKPTPFMQVRRLRYVPETDVMYLGGVSAEHPELNYWGNMGSVLCRYNDWSKGNRTKLFEIVLPSDVKAGPCTQSFDVAGDYLFTSISVGRSPFLPGEIRVYNNSTATFVGKLVPPAKWSVGWNDMVEVLNVTKRANGEYIVIQEEDGRNKNIMLRWCPTGDCSGECTTKVDSVSLNFNKITFDGLTTKTLSASVYPEAVCHKEVFWKSMDQSIVKVDKNGVLTSLKVGTTWVKAASNQQANKADSCLVTVSNVAVSGITFEKDSVKLPLGAAIKLNVNFLPINAVNRDLTWKNMIENIVSVNDTGLITGLLEGSTRIIASSADGNFRDTCFLEVIPVPIQSFKLKSEYVGLWVGNTIQMSVEILPENAANKSIEWLVLDQKIASVTPDGIVKAISIGETKLIAANVSGGIKDTCLIKVLPNDKFINSNIGNVCINGSYSENNGVVTMTGSGADIWGFVDAFHYAYTKKSTDIVIIARVKSMLNTNEWAKAGVMIRESLTEGSKHVNMVLTPGNGTSFQYRSSKDNSSYDITPKNGAKFPYWVKLVKQGDKFSGYSSPNGIHWVLISSTSVSMTTEINIGLCLTAHEECVLNTAKFDHVIVSENLDTIPNITAIESIDAASEITLYPNPATDFVTIDLGNTLGNGAARIQIADLLGKQVYDSNKISQTTAFQVNTSQLCKGIYIVNILKGAEKVSKKLVIQ